MQLFSTIPTLLLLTFKCVSATNEIRFIFNLGLSASPTAGCHLDSERNMIEDALNSFTGSRSLGLFDGIFDDEKSRTAQCKNLCAGIAPGCCWKKGCIGYRNLRNTDRNLQTCADEINSIHAKLDEVLNKVPTASCKLFLQRSRRIARCYPDHVYGQIEGIRVWNNVKGAVIASNQIVGPNLSVIACQNQRFTIEAMNEPCIKYGTISLLGPNKYNHTRKEYVLPLTLFGNNDVEFWTKPINATGTYNLAITPDGDISKTKKFTVFVVKC